jgi:chromosomal replication initiation ATPase DnaA
VLRCPDRFSRDWLRGRYGKLIEECAGDVRGVDYRVDPVAASAASSGARASRAPTPEAQPVARGEDSGAQERLFESFIEGPGNALALEAARTIARGHAGRCNRCSCTGTGMGKTHLCRAIHRSSGTSLYRSSEEFTTEVTEAMRAARCRASASAIAGPRTC